MGAWQLAHVKSSAPGLLVSQACAPPPFPPNSIPTRRSHTYPAPISPPTPPAQVLALEMLILMLDRPSDDSVEMATEFVKEVGAFLQDVAPQGLHRWVRGPLLPLG